MYKTNCSTCSYKPISDTINNKLPAIEDNIKVYPNPNNGTFTVSILNTSGSKTATIEIYSLLGQLVKSIPNQSLLDNSDNLINVNMDNVPSGSYIMRCVTDKTVKVTRIEITK